jgi:hypothetical protein
MSMTRAAAWLLGPATAVALVSCGLLVDPESLSAGGGSDGSVAGGETSTEASPCTAGQPDCSEAGTIVCKPGVGDCNGDAIDGCETDLQTSSSSCGACGHSCQGGACKAGVCQPVPLASGPALWLQTDGTYVFWTDFGQTNGKLTRINVDGSIRFPIASYQAYPDGLSLDATSVYWVNYGSGQVMHANKDGTDVHVIATSAGGNPFWVAVDDTDVYWSNNVAPDSGGGIYRAPKTAVNATPTTFAARRGYPRGVAVDRDAVYWCEDDPVSPYPGFIMKAAKSGAAPQKLATVADGALPWTLVLDATSVYFCNSQMADSVYRVNKDGTGFERLTPAQAKVSFVAVDEETVYFSIGVEAGSIMKLPKHVPGAIATPLLAGVGSVGALVVDDKNVYFTLGGADGGILRVAK